MEPQVLLDYIRWARQQPGQPYGLSQDETKYLEELVAHGDVDRAWDVFIFKLSQARLDVSEFEEIIRHKAGIPSREEGDT